MKIIVGERINTTRPPIRHAVDTRDAALIAHEARLQKAHGATHIDINAGGHGRPEMDDLAWLIQVVQDAVDLPLCIDSADHHVLTGVIDGLKKRPIINSISLETKQMNGMRPFLEAHDCDVVGLCMSDEGLPGTADEIVSRAQRLVRELDGLGIDRDRQFIDPLVQPIATNHTNGHNVIKAVRNIRETCPGIHIISGLSNISFGMPGRKQINRCFLGLLMAAGLSAAILDPLDADIMADVTAHRMLLGMDPYCLGYIAARKNGLPRRSGAPV